MTIPEEMREVFKNTESGTEFTTSEIKQMVQLKFGRNTAGVIPSDYCYNRLNNEIEYEKQLHLFEYTKERKYKYLGPDYCYTGQIIHKPKGGFAVVVGKLENGVLTPCDAFEEMTSEKAPKPQKGGLIHKTKRDVSVSLRYSVMKRDNFRCCACGASPAKDSAVELHIDHIIPWSKGGETVLDNLQTLCSKCNLGKSDSV